MLRETLTASSIAVWDAKRASWLTSGLWQRLVDGSNLSVGGKFGHPPSATWAVMSGVSDRMFPTCCNGDLGFSCVSVWWPLRSVGSTSKGSHWRPDPQCRGCQEPRTVSALGDQHSGHSCAASQGQPPRQAFPILSRLSCPQHRQPGLNICRDRPAHQTQGGGLSQGHMTEGQFRAANTKLPDFQSA